jgi:hypothetical protein
VIVLFSLWHTFPVDGSAAFPAVLWGGADTVRCTLALLDHLVAQIASAASFDGATEN